MRSAKLRLAAKKYRQNEHRREEMAGQRERFSPK